MQKLWTRTVLGFCLALGVAACGPAEDETTAQSTEQLSTADRARPDLIECRTDRSCPRGSYCEPGLNYCFTGSRCYVEGRPSDEFCRRTYGPSFICFEYATDSHHCVPTE